MSSDSTRCSRPTTSSAMRRTMTRSRCSSTEASRLEWAAAGTSQADRPSRWLGSLGSHRGECRCAGLQFDLGTERNEADGVVPAAEEQEIEELLVGELGGQLVPELIGDGGIVMEGIDHVDQGAVVRGLPTRIR